MAERELIANPDPQVTVVEVGPRDGLQNESAILPVEAKVAFIDALAGAGLQVIETTSFVNPKAIPQLADADEVMRRIRRRPGVRYPVLVPNERGLDRAIAAGVDAIGLFTAASEEFCQANVRCSIDESFARFAPVVERARTAEMWVRGYVSVAFGCPYSGAVAAADVRGIAGRLFDLGCDEVAIADTIGVAQPADVEYMLEAALSDLPPERIALHFHDTQDQAIANVATAIERGIRIFDSAAGGLGGCPFAPGAPGNLATEELIAYIDAHGMNSGVSRAGVIKAVSDLRAAMAEAANVDA